MSTAEAYPSRRDPAEALPQGLEARLVVLAETVARLEARVAALEGAVPEQPAASPRPIPCTAVSDPMVPAPGLPSAVRLMGLIGRTCLILGGATFIRALVDAGTIHRGWGVALGLAYAIIWALLAARAKHPLDSAFHALASILIAYPLIVESTARFGILEPVLAALLLFTVTGIHGVVAWRRDLQPIIWTATLASILSGFAMMSARRSIEPFLAVSLLLGATTLWVTYGRRWQSLRWPTALASDLGVVILTSLAAWPGGIPEAYRGITPGRTVVFALALVLIYLGSFAVRMLQRRRVVNAFEVAQSILVLLLGFGGALRVSLISGSGAGLLGAGVSLAGLGCYATAFPFRDDQEETHANFIFFLFFGLVFLLLGVLVLLPLPGAGALGSVLGLAAMLLALQSRRAVFIIQSALYLGTGALASGFAAWSLRAFLAPTGPDASLPWSAALSLVLLALAFTAFLWRRAPGLVSARVRPLVLCLGAAVAAGLGALAIWICCHAFSTGAVDPSLLAAVRTGVLSALIISLAWFGRRAPDLELKWLVYPVMIITALKFLFEDLAVGRPLTLFLGFMCYGATLMLAPRLLKNPTPSDRDRNANDHMPEVHP
ncbi:hypothetical protein GETHLI_03730 [Geothrix limicola]|uniref:DUF2339 domain-containing protein n=1 Tax=Geothrix limicola TaxID=2927978 RepID=A0ABQ5QBQ8_9BACT|nr:hypothetical protein [Geothrix limicola]GLH71871.1 hypothetical protein GETHLI_03730 [Geothrix limicola]